MCHRHDTENDNKNEQNNNRKAKNKGSFGRYVPSNRFISLLYDFFKFFIYRLDLLVIFEVGGGDAPLPSVGPIDVDEVLADIRRDLTDFGVVLGVCFERFIGDVLVELPHIAGPEELPWRKFVDEHVTIS